MKRTVSRLFNSHESAVQAVAELEAAGFAHDDISLISGDHARTSQARSFAPRGSTVPGAAQPAHEHETPDNIHAQHGLAAGAAVGGAIGGGAGLVAGIGLLAIPGMGPVLAAGFLVSALAGAATGAATGGMLGALRDDAGLSEAEAHVFTEGVRRGGAIVTVRAPEDRMFAAEEILVRNGGVEAAESRARLEAEGWTPEAGRRAFSDDEERLGRTDPGV